MVKRGNPEEYFGATQRAEVLITEPIPPIQAKMIEPVEVRYVQSQLQADYTPLIIGVCFIGTICFLAFLAVVVLKK